MNSPDSTGTTPSKHAALQGHADVLEFLEANGADDDRGRLSLNPTPMTPFRPLVAGAPIPA